VTPEPGAIERAFAAVGPWESRFVIDGRAYGGKRPCADDGRVPEFFRLAGAPTSVLELGSFEGGHSSRLAEAPSVGRVVCLEGREENVRRARVVLGLLGLSDRVEVQQVDLEHARLAAFGSFDAAFCVGLLYHLSQPWLLLRELRRRARVLFLDTHVSATDHIVLAGYRGSMYRELGLEDTQSGLESFSFWPTAEALTTMLADAGFAIAHRQDWPEAANGPRIQLLCEVRPASG
jgi:SAM-dependent methyltransferase